MKGRPTPLSLELTASEKLELESWVRKHTCPQSKSLRSRIILMFNEGNSISEIARECKTKRDTVRKWIKRFLQSRIEGLNDLPRPGCPPIFSP